MANESGKTSSLAELEKEISVLTQEMRRVRMEGSQNLKRAKTRDTGVPRVGPSDEKYISSGSSDIFENGQLSPINQMSMRAKTRQTNELGSFVVDDKSGSLGNRLRSLVGLGQRIVAKYPETFNSKAFKEGSKGARKWH